MPLITAASPDEKLPSSALLFGTPKSGKSTSIATRIIEKTPDARVFWACLDNARVFSDSPELLEKFDVGVYSDWLTFDKQVKKILAPAKPLYDVIVLDGISALARLYLDFLAPSSAPSVPQWGMMSRDIHRAVRALKDTAVDFYGTVQLKEVDFADAGKKPQLMTMFDLNADLAKRLLPEFARAVYCYAEATDNGIEYQVNADAAALQFSVTQFDN